MGPAIFLVHLVCSSDLLTCHDLSAQTGYRDMGECQAARTELLRRNAGPTDAGPPIFARCQYVLADETRRVGSARGMASQLASGAPAW